MTGERKAGAMDSGATIGIDEVREVLVTTLGIEDRADEITPRTPLLGSLPELDSMAVLELVLALEERFGVVIDGQAVTAEAFATLETLTDCVAAHAT